MQGSPSWYGTCTGIALLQYWYTTWYKTVRCTKCRHGTKLYTGSVLVWHAKPGINVIYIFYSSCPGTSKYKL